MYRDIVLGPNAPAVPEIPPQSLADLATAEHEQRAVQEQLAQRVLHPQAYCQPCPPHPTAVMQHRTVDPAVCGRGTETKRGIASVRQLDRSVLPDRSETDTEDEEVSQVVGQDLGGAERGLDRTPNPASDHSACAASSTISAASSASPEHTTVPGHEGYGWRRQQTVNRH